ncbi:major facilitator superfamily [Xylariales sp. AK1849]|nr:major facilitator superfamily [Xylariales sp. AK1849]
MVDPPPTDCLTVWREVLVVCVICSCQLAAQYGLGQCLSILHVIGGDLGVTQNGELGWFIAGYSLTVGTFILMSGRLGDLYGYKRLLIAGSFWFSLWSLMAGLSVYLGKAMFILSRVFQGLGAAVLLPNSLGLLGGMYAPGRKKNMVFAVFGACAPIGCVLGSCIASLFALVWWPWVFWSFSIALMGLGLLSIVVVPEGKTRHTSYMSVKDSLIAVDPLGSILGVTALLLVNFALNQAPISGWSSPLVCSTLVIGVLLVPVFFFVEARVSSCPLLPYQSLSSEIGYILACIACGWGAFGIWIYYIWQFMEIIRGASPLLASAWLAPVVISGICAALTTGRLLHRVGPASILTVSMCAFLVGTTLLATTPVDQTYWGQLFVSMILMAWGMDVSFPSATVILSDATPEHLQGIAASLVNTVVNYSISLSLGLASTIEVYEMNGADTVDGILAVYRAALYLAIGLASLGLAVSLAFLWRKTRGSKATQ